MVIFQRLHDFVEILCFFNRFYVDFIRYYVFLRDFGLEEFLKSLRNCPNRCHGFQNPECKKPAQFQPADSMCQFLCAGMTLQIVAFCVHIDCCSTLTSACGMSIWSKKLC